MWSPRGGCCPPPPTHRGCVSLGSTYSRTGERPYLRHSRQNDASIGLLQKSAGQCHTHGVLPDSASCERKAAAPMLDCSVVASLIQYLQKRMRSRCGWQGGHHGRDTEDELGLRTRVTPHPVAGRNSRGLTDATDSQGAWSNTWQLLKPCGERDEWPKPVSAAAPVPMGPLLFAESASTLDPASPPHESRQVTVFFPWLPEIESCVTRTSLSV